MAGFWGLAFLHLGGVLVSIMDVKG